MKKYLLFTFIIFPVIATCAEETANTTEEPSNTLIEFTANTYGVTVPTDARIDINRNMAIILKERYVNRDSNIKFSGTVRFINLYGIVVPKRGMPYSPKVEQRINELIKDKDILVKVKKRDNNGDLVTAIVSIGGIDVAEQLILEGLAFIDFENCDEEYKEFLSIKQEAAKAKKINLWSNNSPAKPYDNYDFLNKFADDIFSYNDPKSFLSELVYFKNNKIIIDAEYLIDLNLGRLKLGDPNYGDAMDWARVINRIRDKYRHMPKERISVIVNITGTSVL